ncbi:hypothetical protein BKA70DRAFT_1260046 [Coprinopsis sp. MPI-PUGE-AT-0042]|nr:hypothetical protein BKA70DRAFT_1260046 [Coprinopsis sp. MPI-PUGE-AT-0042]
MQHAVSPHHLGLQIPLPGQGHRSSSFTGAAAGSVRRKTSGNATSNLAGYGAPPPTPIEQVPNGGPGPLPLSPNHHSNCSPLPSLVHLNVSMNLAGKDALHYHANGPPSPSPWEQMGHTYTWVIEQEVLRERRHAHGHQRHGGHMPVHGLGQGHHPHQIHTTSHFKPHSSGKSYVYGKRPTEEWVIKQQTLHFYSSSEDEYQPHTKRGHNSRRYTTTDRGHVPSRRDRERDLENGPGAMPLPRRGKTYDEVMYRYEVDAERWMRHEQDARERRMAEERQRASAKLRVQEELRRIDERIEQRRAEERRILQESRPKIWVSTKEMERRDKEKRKPKNVVVSVSESWNRYEDGWKALSNPSPVQQLGSTGGSDDGQQETGRPLTFEDIPWPLTVPPTSVEDITPEVIAGFLLSPAHSRAIGIKERLRSAQLRWHPDRFRRLLPRVDESDKVAVEEGAGIVARCLNELMEREKGRSSSPDSYRR